MNDLVSVIMPAYNCEALITESIRSVQAQTYENWELLVVNDCSTDRTAEVVSALAEQDPRIRLLHNEENGGASLSRNHAIREAKGKWIAFLDSDDMWKADKLSKQIAFMEEKQTAFSYTFYDVIESDPSQVKVQKAPKKVNYRKMLKRNYVGCLTVIYDAEKVGLVQIPRLDKRNDYALWLTIFQKGFVGDCLEESLSIYRSHQGLSKGSKMGLMKYHYQLFTRVLGYNKFTARILTWRNAFYYILSKIF